MQFYIYKKKIDSESGNIISVFACGKNESQWCWVPTEFVVQLINKGVLFNILLKKGESNYQTGARIEVYNESFLQAVASSAEGDDLESLPTVIA